MAITAGIGGFGGFGDTPTLATPENQPPKKASNAEQMAGLAAVNADKNSAETINASSIAMSALGF